jgi:hypothetical protein
VDLRRSTEESTVPSLSTTVLLLGPLWVAYLFTTWLIGVASRARAVTAGPAGPDLPDNPPPAVVNYLVHGCKSTADAPVGTLVDLAARRHLELYQPGGDAAQVLIRVRDRTPEHLTAYERSVMDRVVEAAGDGEWVSLADLSIHYAEHGYLWSVQFARDVAADARKRRLAADDPGGLQIGLLFVGFLLSVTTACAVPLFVVDRVTGPDPEQVGMAGGLAFLAVVFVLVGALVTACVLWLGMWFSDERLTTKGEEVTARWLGVAHWLRANHGLAELPTASVAVWDRYLAYGAALGLTPVVSDVVDLAVGDRATLWSTYTGTRRPIRADYRRRGRGVGYTPGTVIFYGLLWLATLAAGAYALARWSGRLGPLAVATLALLAAVLAGRALYRIARALLDLYRPSEMTGLVVSSTDFPWFLYLDDLAKAGTVPFFWQGPLPSQLAYYVVVDDGRADVAPVWTVRHSPTHPRHCHVGDIVRLSGHRWCRTVREITVVTPAPPTAKAQPRHDPQPGPGPHRSPARPRRRRRSRRHS